MDNLQCPRGELMFLHSTEISYSFLDSFSQLAVLFPVLGFLEAKRLEGYLKTGEVRRV